MTIALKNKVPLPFKEYSMSIKVIIAGFKGRMGQAAYKMVSEDPELELAGLIDPFTDESCRSLCS